MSEELEFQPATTPQGQKLAIVKLEGNLDVTAAGQVRRRLYAVIAQGYPNLLLDVEAVGLVDSSGLGVLVSALHRCRTLSGTLCLCQAPESLRMVLDLTSMQKALICFPTLDEGIQQFPTSALFRYSQLEG
jgi:anti-sigma B factor antagonist